VVNKGSSSRVHARLRKLRKRTEFLEVSKNGQRIYVGKGLLANVARNNKGHFRCGWTIPKYVGSAVTRNRIRRWCREFFRAAVNEGWDPSVDMNLVIRKQDKEFYKKLEHGSFKRSLRALKEKISKRIYE